VLGRRVAGVRDGVNSAKEVGVISSSDSSGSSVSSSTSTNGRLPLELREELEEEAITFLRVVGRVFL